MQNDTAYSSSPKCTFEYMGAEKEAAKKVGFYHHLLLLSSFSQPTKELIYTQNDITLIVVVPFSQFVCNWQERRFWLATVL